MDSLIFLVALGAALGCGLIAGVFFAFSTFVMKALTRLPANEGIAAMQAINSTVINPYFMSVFLGTAVLCLLLVGASFLWELDLKRSYLLVGALFYLVGTLGVTAFCNVPLNNALAAVMPTAPESSQLWHNYVATWTAWNHLRGAAALAALAALIMALCP
jgi:uncharacterized membrane protein